MLAVALTLAIVFTRLGFWQWNRAALTGEPERNVVPISSVQQPGVAVAEPALVVDVSVSGTYDATNQLRVLGGVGTAANAQAADWVLTPLLVPQPDGSTATLAVVRGWVDAGTDLPAPPTGPIELTGRLLVTENPAAAAAAAPQGTVHTVATGQLLNIWPGTLYSPFLLALTEDPAQDIQRVPPPSGGVAWAVQNVSYAIQWWLFAGFVMFIWWRMVKHASEPQSRSETA